MTTLHYTTLHTTVHTTLHYTTLHTTLHYILVYYTTYCTTHYTTLHYTTLHYVVQNIVPDFSVFYISVNRALIHLCEPHFSEKPLRKGSEQSERKARAVQCHRQRPEKKKAAKMQLPRANQTSHVHQILIRPVVPRDPKVLRKSPSYTN